MRPLASTLARLNAISSVDAPLHTANSTQHIADARAGIRHVIFFIRAERPGWTAADRGASPLLRILRSIRPGD